MNEEIMEPNAVEFICLCGERLTAYYPNDEQRDRVTCPVCGKVWAVFRPVETVDRG